MKVILELEITKEDIKELKKEDKSDDEIEQYLVDSLFEVCQEWVLGRAEPDLKIVK